LFDKNLFDPYSIGFLLSDEKFFQELFRILKNKQFFDVKIWEASFAHDFVPGVIELLES